MTDLTRRTFLKQTATVAGAAATFSISGTRASGQIIGANDDIRVGVIGVHGRGGSHLSEYQKQSQVRVAAVCDVDLRVLDARAEKMQGVKKYQDIRRLLDSKEIDVISVATPNHWHSLMTVWACEAGKDVYVEKPCSHNVFEGRQCVAAARKYGRIVQHGTQSRSGENHAKLAAIAKSGKYGKLLVSKGYCCKPRWSIGYKPLASPPHYLDYNIWLGPAQKQPFHENIVHYNWHWFWDFGNGDMGNQGVHEIDKARWFSGGTLPRSVMSLGGRWVDTPDHRDQGQTPNQIISVFDYGDSLVLFETRGLVGKMDDFPRNVSNELYFESGMIKGNKFYPKGKNEGEPLVDVDHHVNPGGPFGNFINCVRTRKREELNAEILEGHYSSALCHLGNVSYRMGLPAKYEKPSSFSNNAVVGDSVMTLLENTKAIGVDPEKTKLWVGPKLDFDPAKEKFVNNPAADELLTRPYREPFVVPEQV